MSTRDDGQDAMLEINSDLNLMNTQMNLTQQQEIALHKKHIQALWRHVQRLEKLIQGIPECESRSNNASLKRPIGSAAPE